MDFPTSTSRRHKPSLANHQLFIVVLNVLHLECEMIGIAGMVAGMVECMAETNVWLGQEMTVSA